MIDSIDVERRRILMQSPLGGQNKQYKIYKADSLNVIIGNNGSGKTRALRRIVEAMVSGGESLGCQVNVTDSGKAKTDLADHGVIYYTAIPYPVRLPEEDYRFKNASLTVGSGDVVSDIDMEHFAHLSKELKIKTRPLITMSFDVSSVVPMLAKALVRCISESNVDLEKLQQFFPVREIAGHSTGILKALIAIFRQVPQEEIEKRKITATNMVIAEQICDSILHIAHTCLGDHDLPALSALQALAEERRDLNAISIIFFNDVLGINLSTTDYLTRVGKEISERLKMYLDAKNAIFNAGNPWERSMRSGVMRAETAYDNSEILKLYGMNTLGNFAAVEWENFSSGQLALLYQFTAIHRSAKQLHDAGATCLLLLLDEGDIFLHASWQQRYMELLDDFVGKLRKEFKFSAIQLILTTHSPTVITDIPSQFILRLSQDEKSQPSILSFAATPQDVINASFNSDSMGSLAEKILKKTARDIRTRGANARDEYIISLVDDPLIKDELERLRANYSYLNDPLPREEN